MKKITVCLMLAAVAMVSSLQAADCCEKGQTAAKKTKATVATKTTASCGSETSACGAKKSVVRIDYNIRGATLLAIR